MPRGITDFELPEGLGVAEYIWIDGTGLDLRSKQRTLTKRIESVDDLPYWNFDGSSTYQAKTSNSEIILKPVAVYRDPFKKGNSVLVVCETYAYAPGDSEYVELIPTESNFRAVFSKIMENAKDSKPWFGIEQEYTLFEHTGTNSKWPLGWPKGGFPGPQGPYYCSVGSANCFGRPVMDAHYRACLHAGVQISGTNGEVMPGQWEFQVGPCEGLKIGDDMICARYLLSRVAEDFNLVVSFDPKPVLGDWNGAGCHTNYSTVEMRNDEGLKEILAAVDKLGKRHTEHIQVYGENLNRLTGLHETSSITEFSHGIGHRGASIRIPTTVARERRGYLEDRRPASNIDPYLVAAIIVDTTVLDSAHVHTIISAHRKFLDHAAENGPSR